MTEKYPNTVMFLTECVENLETRLAEMETVYKRCCADRTALDNENRRLNGIIKEAIEHLEDGEHSTYEVLVTLKEEE